MAFRDLIERIGDRFGLQSGDTMQYALAGALVLVIVIALVSVIMDATDGGPDGTNAPTEMHFYCTETGKEFVLKPGEVEDTMFMVEHPALARVQSPYSGKKTGVQMTRCPNCGKYYVPKEWLEDDVDFETVKLVCPDCGTDLEQWYREKMKKRRKKK